VSQLPGGKFLHSPIRWIVQKVRSLVLPSGRTVVSTDDHTDGMTIGMTDPPPLHPDISRTSPPPFSRILSQIPLPPFRPPSSLTDSPPSDPTICPSIPHALHLTVDHATDTTLTPACGEASSPGATPPVSHTSSHSGVLTANHTPTGLIRVVSLGIMQEMDYPTKNHPIDLTRVPTHKEAFALARRVAVWLTKGGVGKSTTGAHLAAALAMAGRKVLFVDADARQSQAMFYFKGVQRLPGLANLLIHGKPLNELLQIPEGHGERLLVLSCSPGDSEEIEYHLGARQGIHWYMALEKALKPYEHHFDYIIFDCSPEFTNVVQTALYYANELWVPWKVDFLSADSTLNLLDLNLQKLGRTRKDFIRYVIPTMLSLGRQRHDVSGGDGLSEEEARKQSMFAKVRVKAADELIQWLKSEFGMKVTVPIRYAEGPMLEAQRAGALVWDVAPDHPVVEDLMLIVKQIIEDEATIQVAASSEGV